jgi:DNA invertase Pin-like site-specific DNA recombinase
MPANAVAIYARISDDREGASLGVERQVADCQQLAARKGWTVAEVYVDNDVSAYSGKLRPEYRRMLDDIKQGHRDGVIVYDLDRLHRRPKELEEFFEITNTAGVYQLASVAGDVDLAKPDGQFHARIMGAVAAKESADKSRRLKRKHEELAAAGKPSGGGVRPYGYTRDLQIVPEEAAIVTEMARRALAGDSIRSIATDLQERGVRTVKGSVWSQTTIRQLLSSGRISGRREHHGEIVAEAVWPPIITTEMSDRLRRKFFDPSRRTGRSPRRYPLTGLVYCELCGAKLIARPRANGLRRYICLRNGGAVGCGRIYVNAEDLERFIVEAVLYRLDTPALQLHVRDEVLQDAEAANLSTSADADQAQLQELAFAYADKLLSLSEYLTARKRIEDRLQQTTQRIGRLSRHTEITPYVGNAQALRQQWSGLDPARQRAIIAAVLDRIIVGRAPKPGAHKFDPARVRPVWRI